MITKSARTVTVMFYDRILYLIHGTGKVAENQKKNLLATSKYRKENLFELKHKKKEVFNVSLFLILLVHSQRIVKY